MTNTEEATEETIEKRDIKKIFNAYYEVFLIIF